MINVTDKIFMLSLTEKRQSELEVEFIKYFEGMLEALEAYSNGPGNAPTMKRSTTGTPYRKMNLLNLR